MIVQHSKPTDLVKELFKSGSKQDATDLEKKYAQNAFDNLEVVAAYVGEKVKEFSLEAFLPAGTKVTGSRSMLQLSYLILAFTGYFQLPLVEQRGRF